MPGPTPGVGRRLGGDGDASNISPVFVLHNLKLNQWIQKENQTEVNY